MAVHPCDTGSPISAVARNRKDEPASYGNTRKVNTSPTEGRCGEEPRAAEAVVADAVAEAVRDAVAEAVAGTVAGTVAVAETAGVPVAVAAATVVVGCASTV